MDLLVSAMTLRLGEVCSGRLVFERGEMRSMKKQWFAIFTALPLAGVRV